MESDKAFSNYSKEHGKQNAILKYIANEGVMLKPNYPPIVGKHKADASASIAMGYILCLFQIVRIMERMYPFGRIEMGVGLGE